MTTSEQVTDPRQRLKPSDDLTLKQLWALAAREHVEVRDLRTKREVLERIWAARILQYAQRRKVTDRHQPSDTTLPDPEDHWSLLDYLERWRPDEVHKLTHFPPQQREAAAASFHVLKMLGYVRTIPDNWSPHAPGQGVRDDTEVYFILIDAPAKIAALDAEIDDIKPAIEGANERSGSSMPMTDGQKAVWDALRGSCKSAKELASDANTSAVTVRQHIMDLRRAGRKITLRSGRGYWRPDAPPPE